MPTTLTFASIAEANAALKKIKAKKSKAGKRAALRGAELRHGKPAKAVKARARSQVRTATTPPAESVALHPADVKRVKAMARRAVREALREQETPTPTAPAATTPPASDLVLTGAALWDNRGKVLTAFAATSGPAAPFWSAYENGEPLSRPLSDFTAGPHPYGGDTPTGV